MKKIKKYKKALRKALKLLAEVELENERLRTRVTSLEWQTDSTRWGA